jgi:hypothetical protein
MATATMVKYEARMVILKYTKYAAVGTVKISLLKMPQHKMLDRGIFC